ncbi:hypothetical protein [Pengzhenrongella frigida]|uniref:Uncharacterized protein n=1 Tax=Pengzhenrongella frigida TaxID=1259133 RepID=A0A4Q5MZG9_9MICO|nr:hypothetical protein [Cellulomonas sp. HLT2-17]RYV51120.1 hypothetical protein EUA98_10095 [Cellulomonas sp. HLT2-17]
MPDQRVIDVVALDGCTRAEVLELAGALAAAAGREAATAMHPVLAALARAATADPGERGPEPVPTVGGDGVVVGSAEVRELRVEATPGTGLSGLVRTAHSGLLLGRRVLVGSSAWLAAEGARPADTMLASALAAAEATGTPAVLLAWNGTPRAVLTLRG